MHSKNQKVNRNCSPPLLLPIEFTMAGMHYEEKDSVVFIIKNDLGML